MNFEYKLVITVSTDIQVTNSFGLFQDTDFKLSEEEQEEDRQTSSKFKFNDWRETDWFIHFTNLKTFNNKMITGDKDLITSKYLGHGIIKLFKSINDGNDDGAKSKDEDILTIPGDDTMVCILFVPTYFTVHDLLHYYIGDDIINNQISNFRILKNLNDVKMGFNFMVLMKFKDPLMAKTFKDKFNGKSFSKIDPEKCHVISIKEIVFKKNLFINDAKDFPYLLTDPFTTTKLATDVELPTCPVCLERMDSETTGLITIPCQHTFHCQCLDKWKNSQCPVCRYSSFRISRDSLLKQVGNSAHCEDCNSNDNLWICLICGNIGCSRYNLKHAISHYETTSHCFAMDMKTQRVWDYASDNYVHRLVQNEVDGKLVEITGNPTLLGSSSSSAKDHEDYSLASNFLRNKEYHLEYVQVLISQLESQREYYETKLSEKENDSKIDDLTRDLDHLKLRFKESELKKNINEVKLNNEAKENKLIIRGLQDNLDHLEKQNDLLRRQNESLVAEKNDLNDQVKDLMFYLETQEKFKDASEEDKNGTVIIQQPPASSSKSKKKRPKSNKKK
ncbi:hypothetical protein KAFR_0A01990 [Kazachstania africana CBS 2517]|uniref:RING-type domain-containing protein n=1 Tax=Kazachstania africana (strain ATCC 22294 / BCRC 22015 / CBS 2517 / CECT 1963 / NBRC 1671 / NRRL Y-8276) TaxID=1071382 RepID=H2AMN7_KAZAF|nr:hypothetical protein KAFR_0A01990 [Kazachstania africana CBS 2517]CCF55637.1 hypothetical protein KAFR_0A01990 [Kazachstania africana CBS 2517]